MVEFRGRIGPPGLALATIRIPSKRQGFRRQNFPGPTANILLNVVRSETHTISNTLTRAPVDGEADRAQHIISEPIRLSLTAIVSAATDTPIDSNSLIFTGPDLGLRVDGGIQKPNVSQILRQAQLAAQIGTTGNFSGLRNYSTFWARLKALNNERKPFDYISDLQVYKDMVFSSIVVERNTREWIEFTAELEEFRTVGVTRDRWLSDFQLDRSRDPHDAGTNTTSPVEVQNLTPEAPPFTSGVAEVSP